MAMVTDMFVCLFALNYLFIANAGEGLTNNFEKLMEETESLQLSLCRGLGYNKTSKINFMKENQRKAVDNVVFKALLRLDRAGCSPLVRNFACSIFAPSPVGVYGVLPPCKSFCFAVTKACGRQLRFASFLTSFSAAPCKLTRKGQFYRGKAASTKDGIKCQKWSSQMPHRHSITPDNYPDKDLVRNYCRNPDGEPKGPWCYTISKKKRWDYCDLSLCTVHLHCDKFQDDGCINYVYDKDVDDYRMIRKGIPKKSQLLRWINEFSTSSVKKMFT